MKRFMTILMVIALSLAFVGCAQDTTELDEANASLAAEEKKVTDLTSDLSTANTTLETAQANLEDTDENLEDALAAVSDAEDEVEALQLVLFPILDDDGDVFESFTFDNGSFNPGWAENIVVADDVAFTHDIDDGVISTIIKWSSATAFNGKSYITKMTNNETLDGTGKTLVVKIKTPTEFLDGDGTNYPGIKLYVKGSDWIESSMWFSGWNIGDSLAGNDQTASGITMDTESGYITLQAAIGTDITTTDTVIYELGVVFEQNADTSLTDDMELIIDYIDLQ